jgi:hypothetical protein
MVSVCFLRTQQRAKSQCMINVQTPVGAGSSDLVSADLAMNRSWLGFWFPAGSFGGWLVSVIQRRV